MGAKVTYTLAQSDKFNATGGKENFIPKYIPGQIIWVVDMDDSDPRNELDIGSIYVDFHDKRICFSKATGMNYVGIAAEDPSTKKGNGEITLMDETKHVPRNLDMVVWESKEFIWRRGEDKEFGWFEIGDEDSPTWNT